MLRKLTDLNRQLAGKRLGELRELSVTAPDGGRVPSWILLPPGYQPGQRVPTILEIHGGPAAAYGPFFSTDYQLYAAAGYAVLFTNPRGSTSYGQAFTDGIERRYPGPDYDDLMAAVDGAVAAGLADPDNLFVTGGSGGGVLTAWIVGKTDRFRAAATQKPVINMVSQVLTADGVPYFARYWFGKMPWEDPQGYWKRSPLEPGRQREDADPGGRRERGLPHPGERSRAILFGAAVARACRPRWSRCRARATASPAGRASRPPRPARSSRGSTSIGNASQNRTPR